MLFKIIQNTINNIILVSNTNQMKATGIFAGRICSIITLLMLKKD